MATKSRKKQQKKINRPYKLRLEYACIDELYYSDMRIFTRGMHAHIKSVEGGPHGEALVVLAFTNKGWVDHAIRHYNRNPDA